MTSEGSRYEASRAYVKLFKSPIKKNGRRVRKVYYFFFFFQCTWEVHSVRPSYWRYLNVVTGKRLEQTHYSLMYYLNDN